MALALLPARSSSAALRFRGTGPMARSGAFQIAVPTSSDSGTRQIARPRVPSLVPSRTPKADTAGAVIGGVLPAALTLAGARVIDRSRVGRAVKEITGGAELSDVAGGAAIVLRMTGLDGALPAARPQLTRLIQAKVFDWAGKAGDAAGDAMDAWDAKQQEKKKGEAAPVEKSAAKAETKAPPVEVHAAP